MRRVASLTRRSAFCKAVSGRFGVPPVLVYYSRLLQGFARGLVIWVWHRPKRSVTLMLSMTCWRRLPICNLENSKTAGVLAEKCFLRYGSRRVGENSEELALLMLIQMLEDPARVHRLCIFVCFETFSALIS